MIDYDVYSALKEMRKEEGERSRVDAASQYRTVARVAASHGVRLVRRSNAHYQVTADGHDWLINLYPGNGRVYADKNRGRAPFLRVGRGWTLADAVVAVLREINKGGSVTHEGGGDG